MSARVNLLPPEIAQRKRDRRVAAITAVVVLAYAVALAGVYMLKLTAVADARADRDVAQQGVTTEQARLAQLQPYAALDRELADRDALLTTTMDRQIAWARVLNDLSLAFPANSSLLTLTASTDTAGATPGAAAAVPSGPTIDPGAEGVADLLFTGYSVESYAPGVESVLLNFDDVSSFFNPYIVSAAREQRGTTTVTAFNGSVGLSRAALSQRYADGLPPATSPARPPGDEPSNAAGENSENEEQQ